MSAKNETADVIIVGAGPVGLSAAYLLGSYGLRVQLFEKRPGYSTHYRGPHLAAATSELHRRWGVLKHTKDREWQFDRIAGITFAHTIKDEEILTLRKGNKDDWVQFWHQFSPEVPHYMPSAVQEEGLHKQIQQFGAARVDYGYEVTALTQDDDGVTVTAHNIENPEQTRRVNARYIIAADGGRSTVGALLGAEYEVSHDFGPQVSVTFDGDLDRYLSFPQVFQVFITSKNALGYFSRRRPDFNSWGYIYPVPEDRLPTAAEAEARIREAVGDPDFPLKIVDIGKYRIRSRIIKNYRHGRVFFAGDSAHSHSPWAGFGQNLGIPDANNLAWKLAAVLQGHAGDALLDSYEDERKFIGLLVIKATAFNDYHYWDSILKAYWELEGQDANRRAANAYLRMYAPGLMPGWSWHVGLQFSGRYVSQAVVGDGGPPPASAIGEHVRSGAPGARAPHLWLTSGDGDEVSTVDLFGKSFVLLADGAGSGWKQAAEGLASLGVATVAVIEIGPQADFNERDESWKDIYGVQAGGAVLVRPDGHVGARFEIAPDDRAAGLQHAVNTILHRI